MQEENQNLKIQKEQYLQHIENMNKYISKMPYSITIKPGEPHEGDYPVSSIINITDYKEALKNWIKEEYKSHIWKNSNKPVCWIQTTPWNGTFRSRWQHNEILLWMNPALALIPNLLDYFNSYEEIFQEIEQYLWNDVEMKDPMINITNDDRIVGHGFDLKSSFRKEKKNA